METQEEVKFTPTDELTITIKTQSGTWASKRASLTEMLYQIADELNACESYPTNPFQLKTDYGTADFVIKSIMTKEMLEKRQYIEACRLVAETQNASVSLLQRRLRISYTLAAKFIDAMERDGLVGPYNGAAPRKVNIRKSRERL
jgi:DNA segregation ATPase FtsK/SpoIIIE-like protein